MNTTSHHIRSLAPAIGLVLGASLLVACGQDATAVRAPGSDDVVQQSEQYVGDPWEKRFRQDFWADQHIHDSWNRCHLGENISPALRRLAAC